MMKRIFFSLVIAATSIKILLRIVNILNEVKTSETYQLSKQSFILSANEAHYNFLEDRESKVEIPSEILP